MGRSVVRFVIAILALVSACGYNAEVGDCHARCDETSGCPDGMTCSLAEHMCRTGETSATCAALDAPISTCSNPSGAVVDLAISQPASADVETAHAYFANDGDDATSWNGGDGEPGHWWQVDLGSDRQVASLETLWEYDGIHYRYLVAMSLDGTSFATAIDQTSDTRTTRSRTDAFPAATCARYVRITKTDSTGYWAVLFTVRIMGR